MKHRSNRKGLFIILIIITFICISYKVMKQESDFRNEYKVFIESHTDYSVIYNGTNVGEVSEYNLTLHEYRNMVVKVDRKDKLVHIMKRTRGV